MKIMQLSENLIQKLRNYVYLLQDPLDGEIFYIGRGYGNRIFDHAEEAKDLPSSSGKINRIKNIWTHGKDVEYYIIRYGLNEESAVEVEAAIIDFLLFKKTRIENEKRGSGSLQHGFTSLTALMAQNEEVFLDVIPDGFVAININKRFQKWSKEEDIYEMVRQSWVIDIRRIGNPESPNLKIVLAEVRGVIVAAFEVTRWYQVEENGKRRRWAFDGKPACRTIQSSYLHRSIRKKQGAAFPLTYHKNSN